jgi:hypothetical protein
VSSAARSCRHRGERRRRPDVYRNLLHWRMSMVVVIRILTWLSCILPGEYAF